MGKESDDPLSDIRDEVRALTASSSTADGAGRVAHAAPYRLTITGFDLLMHLAPGMGLAVAGHSGVVVFDPHLVALVKPDLLDKGER